MSDDQNVPPTPEQFMAYGEHHDSCVIWREGICDCGFAELYRAAEKIAGPQLHIEQVRSSAPQEPVAWITMYPDGMTGIVFKSRAEADRAIVKAENDDPVLGPVPTTEPLYLAPLPSSPTAPPLNALAAEIHAGNKKWWFQADGVTPLARNKGELLMLVVTEVAEAMEGERKNLMDDKLPHRRMAEVEIVDAIVRLLDYAAGFGYDLDDVLREKLAYNATRADHKAEAARLVFGNRLIDGALLSVPAPPTPEEQP